MQDQDAAALAAYQASLRKLTDVEEHFNEYLVPARVAERLAKVLGAEARSELQKVHMREAAVTHEAEEFSLTP